MEKMARSWRKRVKKGGGRKVVTGEEGRLGKPKKKGWKLTEKCEKSTAASMF